MNCQITTHQGAGGGGSREERGKAKKAGVTPSPLWKSGDKLSTDTPVSNNSKIYICWN